MATQCIIQWKMFVFLWHPSPPTPPKFYFVTLSVVVLTSIDFLKFFMCLYWLWYFWCCLVNISMTNEKYQKEEKKGRTYFPVVSLQWQTWMEAVLLAASHEARDKAAVRIPRWRQSWDTEGNTLLSPQRVMLDMRTNIRILLRSFRDL